VLDQERFDGLARGLATNQLSRRQVLKSLAASLLLAGPLGALGSRAVSAKSVGCVAPSCVKRAKQVYASCQKRCKPKRGNKREKCLSKCEDTFAEQNLKCGCLTEDTKTSTPSPCKDPCTAQTLYDKANQHLHYSLLVDYLSNNGFAADGSPKALVEQQDGKRVRSLLSRNYSNPTRPNEIAHLNYEVVEKTGAVAASAPVWNKQADTLRYMLAVTEDDGPVQKVFPSPAPQRTSMPTSTVSSTAAAAKTCNSEALSLCREEKASETTLDLLDKCSVPCAVGVPTCLTCEAVVLSKYANKLVFCSEKYGCGPGNSLFCKDNVCCRVSETACGGVCCTSDETCCTGTGSGTCVKCRIQETLDPKTCKCCGTNDPNCCPEGQTTCQGGCVDLLTDASNCGKCGSQCHPSGEDCVGGICKCKPGFTKTPPCQCCPPDRPKCCRTSEGVLFCEASCAGYGMN
jgi:hypothetical protein